MFKRIHKAFHRHYHKRYHGVYAHAKQLFIFDLALLGLAIVMLGAGLYFTFWKPTERHLASLQVLLGSDRIKSGDEIVVTVNYANTSKFVLRKPTLAIHLPAGFEINRTSTPENVLGKNNTLALDDMEPGARGTASIHGRLFSTPGVEDKVVGILTYTPEDTGKQEQEALPFTFMLPASVLMGSVSTVTTTYPGTTIPVTFILENTSDQPISGITLETSSTARIFSEKDLDSFALGGHASRTFKGTVVAPGTGNTLLLGVTPRISVNGVVIPQSQATTRIAVFNPNVTLQASFVNPPSYGEVGGRVSLNLQWKNDGSYTIINQAIEVSFAPGVVDLAATAALNGVKSDGTKLIITKKERTALADGKPGANGQLDLTLQLLPHFNLGDLENGALEVEPLFTGELSAVSGQVFKASGTRLSLPLATELTWSGEARYFTDDGEQLGRGPLPARVGQTTRYFILFDVYNTTNLVSGASFVARLPDNVVFTGKQSVTLGPKLSFDSSTRLVRWSYPQIPANSQTGFYFEVAVTPTSDMIGKNVTLVEDARFSAKDDVVGKPFSLGKGIITNVLPASDSGSRAGAVVR